MGLQEDYKQKEPMWDTYGAGFVVVVAAVVGAAGAVVVVVGVAAALAVSAAVAANIAAIVGGGGSGVDGGATVAAAAATAARAARAAAAWAGVGAGGPRGSGIWGGGEDDGKGSPWASSRALTRRERTFLAIYHLFIRHDLYEPYREMCVKRWICVQKTETTVTYRSMVVVNWREKRKKKEIQRIYDTKSTNC